MDGKTLETGYVLVEVVDGRAGKCLVIGDYDSGERVAGPKPWGGGSVVQRWKVRADDLRRLADEYEAAALTEEAK